MPNTESPVDKTALEYGLIGAFVFLGLVFLLAFTGRKSAWRNQTAIIFSYVIIALFLAVPIVGPVLLIRTFPNVIDAMIGEPAGVVNTHTPNQKEGETQWALNIGGYSYKLADQPGPKSNGGNAPEKEAAPVAAAPAIKSQATDASGTGGKSGGVSGQATARTQSGTGGSVSEGSTPTSPSILKPESGELKPPIVEVQGGLVIPLYVIILSVIGGAINMTRKVPGFQKEGEQSDITLVRPISNLGSRVLQIAGLKAPQRHLDLLRRLRLHRQSRMR